MRRPFPKIEVMSDDMVRMLRGKSPAERLAIADGLWRLARDMIRANLEREHPDWNAEQIQRETARRLSHGAV